MGKSIYTICLDLQNVDSQVTIYAKQGDTDRTIHFTLRDGGKAFELKDTDIVALSTVTPEGKTIEESVTLKNGIAVYEFSPVLTASIGAMNVELRVYSEGKNVISSSFTLVVEARNNVARDITAQDSFTLLDEVYARANLAIEGAVSATKTATEAGAYANEQAQYASESALEAQSAANEARVSAENANNAVELVQGAIEESRRVTVYAQSAAEEATEAATNAENMAYRASEAAQFANMEGESAKEATIKANEASKRANDAADRIENAEIDIDKTLFASAIKDSKSGTTVVLTDVSPFEHTLGVRARSKNLFNGVYSHLQSLNYQVEMQNFIVPEQNKIYALSIDKTFVQLDVIAELASGSVVQKATAYNNTKFFFKVNGNVMNWGNSNSVGATSTFDEPISKIRLYMYGNTDNGWDIEPNVHLEQGAEIASYTPYIADFSTANVQRYGGNMLDFAGREVVNFGGSSNTSKRTFTGKGIIKGFAYNNYYNKDNVTAFEKYENGFSFTNKEAQTAYGIGFDLKALPNTTYLVHCNAQNSHSIYATEYDNDGNILRYIIYPETKNGARAFTTGENTAWVVFSIQNAMGTTSGVYNDVYIGVDVFNGFEEYKEPKTCPINSDGTVDTVTSLYPTTTLIPSDGIVLDVDYIVDTKKYIDNKFAALTALVLEA